MGLYGEPLANVIMESREPFVLPMMNYERMELSTAPSAHSSSCTLDRSNRQPQPEADPNTKLQASDNSDDMELVPYQEAVGSIMFAFLGSRPDIAYALSIVAKYCSNPCRAHWEAVKRILRYLKGTSDYRLCFRPDGKTNIIHGFCNADYAADPDTRRSRSGYIFILNGSPIAWLSQQQGCVATLTTEAEYVAACTASKQAVWLRRLITGIGFSQPEATELNIDNNGAIRLVKNLEFHKRTKHIEVQFHYVRERFEAVQISEIPIQSRQAPRANSGQASGSIGTTAKNAWSSPLQSTTSVKRRENRTGSLLKLYLENLDPDWGKYLSADRVLQVFRSIKQHELPGDRKNVAYIQPDPFWLKIRIDQLEKGGLILHMMDITPTRAQVIEWAKIVFLSPWSHDFNPTKLYANVLPVWLDLPRVHPLIEQYDRRAARSFTEESSEGESQDTSDAENEDSASDEEMQEQADLEGDQGEEHQSSEDPPLDDHDLDSQGLPSLSDLQKDLHEKDNQSSAISQPLSSQRRQRKEEDRNTMLSFENEAFSPGPLIIEKRRVVDGEDSAGFRRQSLHPAGSQAKLFEEKESSHPSTETEKLTQGSETQATGGTKVLVKKVKMIKTWTSKLDFRSTILALQELKVSGWKLERRMQSILPNGKYVVDFSRKGKGRVGLLLHPSFNVLEEGVSGRGFGAWVKIQVGEKEFGLVVLHAPNKRRHRIRAWQWVEEITRNGNWVVLGDLNQVDRRCDTVGPSPFIHGSEDRIWRNLIQRKDMADCFDEAIIQRGPDSLDRR
ncbi:hypothetical protein R1sor_017517 [Riccia sorocarpa]|uniref:Uncharacterized protein n=1 Tax=Riccia sorocarpa TaxID=122646 RepID=A0ABD3I726_9MARC